MNNLLTSGIGAGVASGLAATNPGFLLASLGLQSLPMIIDLLTPVQQPTMLNQQGFNQQLSLLQNQLNSLSNSGLAKSANMLPGLMRGSQSNAASRLQQMIDSYGSSGTGYNPNAALNSFLARVPQLQKVINSSLPQSDAQRSAQQLSSQAARNVMNQFSLGGGANSGAALKSMMSGAAEPLMNLQMQQDQLKAGLTNQLFGNTQNLLSQQYQAGGQLNQGLRGMLLGSQGQIAQNELNQWLSQLQGALTSQSQLGQNRSTLLELLSRLNEPVYFQPQ